jgi:hypothetical protein
MPVTLSDLWPAGILLVVGGLGVTAIRLAVARAARHEAKRTRRILKESKGARGV